MTASIVSYCLPYKKAPIWQEDNSSTFPLLEEILFPASSLCWRALKQSHDVEICWKVLLETAEKIRLPARYLFLLCIETTYFLKNHCIHTKYVMAYLPVWSSHLKTSTVLYTLHTMPHFLENTERNFVYSQVPYDTASNTSSCFVHFLNGRNTLFDVFCFLCA